MTRTIVVALVAAACWATPAAGQQATQRQLDSLAAEVRRLQIRLDSVARAAVRDTAPAPRQQGGARNLNQLNPEISVTSDLRGAIQTETAQAENFELHEVEFSFQAALDPYSHTKIFAGVHDGALEIEEGYFYYTGLPGRVRLDLGLFRQQLGELNRWHLHALPEGEYPLALTAYTGEEGLAGAGASFYWAGSIAGTQEIWAQITAGTNEGLFEAGGRPAVLAHLNNFWQLNRSTYVQLGLTGVYGTNPDSALKTTLGGLDLRLTWRPPDRALYREWTVRGELFAVHKERGGAGATRLGGYLGSTYKLGRRWIAGARVDYVEAPEGPRSPTRLVTPSLTWWQSEWVYLRAQYAHSLTPGFLGAQTKQFALQAVWAIGPHKHETY